MSKSLGNFYTLEDIKTKGFHPLAFRLLCLQAAIGFAQVLHHLRVGGPIRPMRLDGCERHRKALSVGADRKLSHF